MKCPWTKHSNPEKCDTGNNLSVFDQIKHTEP